MGERPAPPLIDSAERQQSDDEESQRGQQCQTVVAIAQIVDQSSTNAQQRRQAVGKPPESKELASPCYRRELADEGNTDQIHWLAPMASPIRLPTIHRSLSCSAKQAIPTAITQIARLSETAAM